jgi:PTH1 family peptidyl-tRNA hydrolase
MLGRLRGLFTRGAEQPSEKMICGLGNPGPSYTNTRHNAGYRVVAGIASAGGIKDAAWTMNRGLARFCAADVAGAPVALVQPLTFMNLSGQAVRPLLRRFNLTAADLLVVHDDLDLPFGAIRLRAEGSAGGHRGVQSIIDELGTREFTRLRIGIGRPPEGEEAVAYVLGLIAWDLRQQWDGVLDQAVAAAQAWVSLGLEAAMNRFNTNRR